MGVDGKFETTADPDQVWANRVTMVVASRLGERVMRSDYGVALNELIFENSLGDTPEDSIRTAIVRWLPNITVQSVTITKPDTSSYEIIVMYSTPDRKYLTTTVGLDLAGAVL